MTEENDDLDMNHGLGDSAMLGDSGYERVDNDFYETPDWVTEVAVKHIPLVGKVWEPAAGKGAIANVLNANGIDTVCSDLIDRGKNYPLGNFLEATEMMEGAHHIFTNPPYGDDAQRFVEKGLDLIPVGGKLIMICRHEWICAKKRRHLFERDSAFAKVIILNKRPRWIAGTKGSPRHNFAIYVWDHLHFGRDAEVVLQ